MCLSSPNEASKTSISYYIPDSKQGYRGTWLSDPIQEKFGRRPALFIAAVFCVALVIGINCLKIFLLASDLGMLYRYGSLQFMGVTTRLQDTPWCWGKLIFSSLLSVPSCL
jgi:hypothetical protein